MKSLELFVPRKTRNERHGLAKQLQSQRRLRNTYLLQGMKYQSAKRLSAYIVSQTHDEKARENISYQFWRQG